MNIIYINPDQMRADVLGCYGHPLAKTPNIDRLADSGVRFDQCHVQHTVCTPSRCSFMTGWYPHTRGHRSLWYLLREDEPNTMKYLKQAGYDVRWSGKNDLLAEGAFEGSVDRVYEIESLGSQALRAEKSDPHYWSFLHEPRNGPHNDEVHFQNCIDYLRNRKPGDPPFFFFLATILPHPPYTVPEPWYSMYKPEDIPPLRIAETRNKPGFHRFIREYRGLDRLDEGELRRIMAVYLGMVSYVDHLIGRLLDALDETGLADETAVFLFSDHGDWTGDYGLVEKWSAGVDDCLTHIPMIVRAPGITPPEKRGHVVREPVECFDIMPTTLELAGVECKHVHDARSMVPQLRGQSGDPGRAVFTEGGYDLRESHCFEGKPDDAVGADPEMLYYPKGLQQQEQPESTCRTVAIRTLSHKLVYRTSGEHELYDLSSDPKELDNRFSDPEMRDVQEKLEKRLLMWFLKTSDAPDPRADSRGFPPGIAR